MTSFRIPVRPEMLRWACDRSGIHAEAVVERVPQLPNWLSGAKQPTLKQLEKFAATTHTPVGLLLMPEPLEESLPIPDFRTVGGRPVTRPSLNLLHTVYACQLRQDWYAENARLDYEPVSFVGSANLSESPEAVAARMRRTLNVDLEQRWSLRTWTEALRELIVQADAAGILVMVSGVVGNNTHRKLDLEEFRGFALVDEWAPLVFINGADSKAAQMFTLAHELAHIWLGESALSDAGACSAPQHEVERWCNGVAAELLAPLDAIRTAYNPHSELDAEVARLARVLKVSPLVVLRRLRDAGHLAGAIYRDACDRELARLRRVVVTGTGGGDFYSTLRARTGKRFQRDLVASTLEGRTLFTEAFRLLGIRRSETFRRLAGELGFTF